MVLWTCKAKRSPQGTDTKEYDMTTKTAPTTITLKTGRAGGTAKDNWEYRDRFDEIAVGSFLSEMLVTDTIVYEVVKVTKATVTLRTTTRAGVVKNHHIDGNPYPVTYEAVVPNPEGKTYTLRVRKDGSIRMGSHAGSRPLYPTNVIDGQPVRKTDYRY